ncbi:unnamed protein product [Prunus armeniaca]|uniref:Uncharacterized protein n=1 Tax=Prunus armeniaca TaxID=36596 RepID=A0A6J5VZ15_PRUAR|nr:unnamed protein product [Prunus armeniaca]
MVASSRYVFTIPRSMHEKHLLVHPIARQKKSFSGSELLTSGNRDGEKTRKLRKALTNRLCLPTEPLNTESYTIEMAFDPQTLHLSRASDNRIRPPVNFLLLVEREDDPYMNKIPHWIGQ